MAGLRVIPDNFIVVFKRHASDAQIADYIDTARALGGIIGHRYSATFRGLSLKISENALATLKKLDFVEYIERDSTVNVMRS